jgi:hypothetical protein
MPWPMPQFMNRTSKSLLVISKKDFNINTNMVAKCDLVDENIKHYKNVLFPYKIINQTAISLQDKLLTELSVEIADQNYCPTYPNSSMDESCKRLIFNIQY